MHQLPTCPLGCRPTGPFPPVARYPTVRGIDPHADLSTPHPGWVEVKRCPDCGIEWLDAAITWTATPDEAYFGLTIQYHRDPEAERRRAATFLDAVHRYRMPPGTLFDLGCGLGTLLRLARERGWEVGGNDLVTRAIEHLRAETGIVAHAGPLAALALPAASVDVITAFCVLPHVPDPAAEVACIRRLLKPGGVLIAEMPADGFYRRAAKLLARLGIDWGVRNVYYAGHRYAFSPRSVRTLLERGRLEVIDVAPYRLPRDLTSRRFALRGGLCGRAGTALVAVADLAARLVGLPNHLLVVAVRAPD